MNNYIQPGEAEDFTAPVGGVVSGTPVAIGALVVFPQTSAAAGAKFAGVTWGIFDVIKTAGAAWAEGQTLYFDSATSGFTTAQSATARRAGTAALAALAGDTVGRVRLLNIAAPVNVA